MKRIETHIIIQADINTVWEAVVTTQNYPAWNPFIIAVAARGEKMDVGTDMEFTVRWQDGSERKTREVVNAYAPPAEINGKTRAVWSYYFKSVLRTIGMVRATRSQVLTSVEAGVTHYHTYEDFRGWGVLFLPTAKIKDGFARQTQALKAYCEGR